MWQTEIPEGSSPLGYRALIEHFNISAIPHFRWSYAAPKWEKRELHFREQNLELHIYPPSYWLPDDPLPQLEFALKHEGINLFIVKEVLKHLSESAIIDFINKTPTGKYARIVWYLYEQLHELKLPLPDLKKGNYVPILDQKLYYCSSGIRSSRHRIKNNLLGNLDFCPIVRRTPLLLNYEKQNLSRLSHTVIKDYDPQVIARAMRYLYTKETMSSWEIEREKVDNARLAKFATLLHRADGIGPLSEKTLVELQKEIVDRRFALETYRTFQNYVGEEPALGQLIIHYICPKPEDVPRLMKGLIVCFERMLQSEIDPVIIAAILSFVFVYIHPFEDGNGRVHRFLIHYALARCGFSPKGLVFPVSAAILRDAQKYDAVLESFSTPLLELITEYDVNDVGKMTITQDSYKYYQYLDLTREAEYLFECVEKTITTDLQQELKFLRDYDNIKVKIKAFIDIPDQRLDLFIKCVRQNGGSLSTRKKESYFYMFSENEINQMEEIVRSYL